MSIQITIRVVPKSSRQQCTRDKNGSIKCYVRSAAQDGKANKELTELIASALKIPKSAVRILMGATARTKCIAIDVDMTVAQVLESLGVETQLGISSK